MEPQVADIDVVYPYTVDDLNNVVDEGRKNRQAAAEQAEEIVKAQVELFMQRMRSLGANDTIKSYRDKVHHTQSQLLDKAHKQLQAGQNPEAVLQHFAHAFGNKLMHAPTKRMREAAQHGDNDLLQAAKSLLDLDTPHK